MMFIAPICPVTLFNTQCGARFIVGELIESFSGRLSRRRCDVAMEPFQPGRIPNITLPSEVKAGGSRRCRIDATSLDPLRSARPQHESRDRYLALLLTGGN